MGDETLKIDRGVVFVVSQVADYETNNKILINIILLCGAIKIHPLRVGGFRSLHQQRYNTRFSIFHFNHNCNKRKQKINNTYICLHTINSGHKQQPTIVQIILR